MKKEINRSNRLTAAILSFLETELEGEVARWNENGAELPLVAEFDSGYRDIFAGLREYPAVIVLNRGREDRGSFSTEYKILIGLVLKSEDLEQLENWGQSYADILEDVIRSNPSLGGACLDVNNFRLNTDCVSGIFVISVEINVELDRGGFIYG